MKKNLKNRLLPVCLAGLCIFQSVGFLNPPVIAFTAVDASIKASTLNVRSGASTKSAKVSTLGRGTKVTVVDEVKGADNLTWYKINYTEGNVQKTGYVSKVYVSTAKSQASYRYDAAFEQALSKEGFPESYKVKLRELHAIYPNWVFKAKQTGLDWNEVIKNEAEVGRLNLVHTSSRSSWKSTAAGAYDWNTSKWTGFDTNAWVAAGEGIIRYYMDPRNFLDESYIFQFAHHAYDANIHKAAGVEILVKGTFMDSKFTGAVSGAADIVSKINIPDISSGGLNNAPNLSGSTNTETENSIGPGGNLNSNTQSAKSPANTESKAKDTSSNVKAQTDGVKLNSEPKANKNQNSMLVAPGITYKAQEVMLVAPSGDSSSSSNLQKSNSGATESSNIGPGGTNSSLNAESTAPVNTQTVINAGLSGSKSYVDIIMQAAATSGVNPYVLASMIIQEQGVLGKSGLISGNTSPYQGYYNFFNIGAYQVGNTSPVQRGLWWASQGNSYLRPWNSKEKAIIGGAVYYGENYVKVGQDTFYLKKYNVQGNNIYKHQYMTNVEGAAHEGVNLAKAYSEELKKGALTFSIPVFKNMPENPEPMPMGDGSPNNKLANINISGFSLTPGFDKEINSYTIIADASVSSLNVSATAISNKASISGTGNINIGSGNAVIDINVKAENGEIRNYKINVARQGSTGTLNPVQNNTENIPQTNGISSGPGEQINSGDTKPESSVKLVAP